MSLQGQQLITIIDDLVAWACARAGRGYDHREITIEVDDVCKDGAAVVRSYRLDLDDMSEIRFGLQQANFADMRTRLHEIERGIAEHCPPVTCEGLRELIQSTPARATAMA